MIIPHSSLLQRHAELISMPEEVVHRLHRAFALEQPELSRQLRDLDVVFFPGKVGRVYQLGIFAWLAFKGEGVSVKVIPEALLMELFRQQSAWMAKSEQESEHRCWELLHQTSKDHPQPYLLQWALKALQTTDEDPIFAPRETIQAYHALDIVIRALDAAAAS
ncbi:MAG: hypothetical protein J0L84_15660 [Verrucomicrobia bacterium]|nr:hypothetical protein [Verrucomicrobiota bacterium]